MSAKTENKTSTILLIVFSVVLGLILAVSPVPARAELDRAQLRDLISGLNVLYDKLAYKRNLLNSDDEGHGFDYIVAGHGIQDSEELVIVLQSSIVGGTAEDRAQVQCLLQCFQKLNSAAEFYLATTWNARRNTTLSRSWARELRELNEAEREKLADFFLSASSENLEANQDDHKARPSPVSTGRSEAPGPGKQDTGREGVAHLSGSLSPGLEGKVFPPWARESFPDKTARVARESVWLALADLKLQYDATLYQIDELRKGIRKKMSP